MLKDTLHHFMWRNNTMIYRCLQVYIYTYTNGFCISQVQVFSFAKSPFQPHPTCLTKNFQHKSNGEETTQKTSGCLKTHQNYELIQMLPVSKLKMKAIPLSVPGIRKKFSWWDHHHYLAKHTFFWVAVCVYIYIFTSNTTASSKWVDLLGQHVQNVS